MEAIECYKKAIEINPNIAEFYSNLGISLGDYGRNMEAIECHRKAIEINPNIAKGFFNLGNSLKA